MKILLMNPHVSAVDAVAKALTQKGHAVLRAVNPAEGKKVLALHGDSVDLAIIHRETVDGSASSGLEWADSLRKDAIHSDLPVILTSSKWRDTEFIRHQSSPAGFNAYLVWPCSTAELFPLIEGVLGISLGSAVVPPSSGGVSVQLENMSALYEPSAEPHQTAGNFVLEAPDMGSFPSALSQVGSVGEIDLSASISLIEQAGGVSVPEHLAMPPIPDSGSLAEQVAAQAPFEEPAPVQEAASFEELPVIEPESFEEHEPVDRMVAARMPYLFRPEERTPRVSQYAKEMADAVVPGGAANAPDTETMKQYLMLREQDVAALSSQLRKAREQAQLFEESLAAEQSRALDLDQKVKAQERIIAEHDREKKLLMDGVQGELDDLRFQAKAKTDRAKSLEQQVREAQGEVERIKERVRVDLRKIRVREKELESRLEIMKRDSEALIGARESKIIELKRRLDLLEFNMDLLQDQYQNEKESSDELRDRLAKAAQIVRVAGGLLDSKEAAALADSIEDGPRKAS